jgi:hypothetical protein
MYIRTRCLDHNQPSCIGYFDRDVIFATCIDLTLQNLHKNMIRSSTAGNNIFTGHKEYGTENQNYKPLQAGATCTLSCCPGKTVLLK